METSEERYYEVIVASQKYHRSERLTYHANLLLAPGTVASIALRNEKALCIVTDEVSKPSFTTKPLIPLVPEVAVPLQLIKLYDWLRTYYPAPGGLVGGLLLPRFLLATSKANKPRTVEQTKATAIAATLTHDQNQALSVINSEAPGPVLLHGDTGTGKTMVYLKAAEEQLRQGKSVIALTPEIGLTPQFIESFTAHFSHVYLVHSGMKDTERRATWRAIADARTPIVVVGTRSALFAPVHNLGLVIVDEFHDGAYKQEQAPYYITTRVASQLCNLHNARLILGSATPTISDYYIFYNKKLPIVRMTTKPMKHGDVVTHTIDLRNKQDFTRSPWLSDKLLTAITEALGHGKQSLLFLNRRGTARLTLCQNCGWQNVCDRCDLPMTFHGDSYRLICHTCGATASVPTSCPSCDSTNIIFKSIGTKTIHDEVTKLFPHARIQRFDSDTQSGERFEHYYQAAKKGDIDILIGTQMLSKGLDLPKLAVVGVVLADTGLYFPDFSASESTYQMLTQVIGRTGRGHGAGTVIVQTYDTENNVIKYAMAGDYDSLYKTELLERKSYGFPPFYHLLKISCSYASASHAQKKITALASDLAHQFPGLKLIGPAPSFIEKSHDKYHWQLTIATSRRDVLIKILTQLPAQFSYDLDPLNLL